MKNILILEKDEEPLLNLSQLFVKAGYYPVPSNDIAEIKRYLEKGFMDFFVAIINTDYEEKEIGSTVKLIIENRIPLITISNQVRSTIFDLDSVDHICKSQTNDFEYAVETIRRLESYKSRKVLIVDDSVVTQKIFKRNLEKLLFNVKVADNGKEALDYIEKMPNIDLVLTDYYMPEINGVQLTQELRKKYTKEELIIIAITGAEESQLITDFLKAGVSGYMSKKCSKDEINYTINNLMDSLKKKEEADVARKELEVVTEKLSKYLSPQVYESIFTGAQDESIHSKRKKLTIFFSDIVSFTDTTENLEAEELTTMLNEYLTLMSNIALKYGATIDKFIGDAIMIFFGDPKSDGVQKDAVKCVQMAMAMQKEMVAFRERQIQSGIVRPFNSRIGIATGFTTVGNFGSKDRLDYTIIGSYVNLASRLESAADKDSVLISEETYYLTKDYFQMEPKQEISVKGFARPVKTYRVISENDQQSSEMENSIRLDAFLKTIDINNIIINETTRETLQKIITNNDTQPSEKL